MILRGTEEGCAFFGGEGIAPGRMGSIKISEEEEWTVFCNYRGIM